MARDDNVSISEMYVWAVGPYIQAPNAIFGAQSILLAFLYFYILNCSTMQPPIRNEARLALAPITSTKLCTLLLYAGYRNHI